MRGLKFLITLLAIFGGTASGALAGSYHPADFRTASAADGGGSDPTNIKP